MGKSLHASHHTTAPSEDKQRRPSARISTRHRARFERGAKSCSASPTPDPPSKGAESPEEFRMRERERSHMIDVPTCTLVDFKN